MNSHEQQALYGEWIQAHAGILHKVARSFCAQEADQEDLLQEIRVAIWQAVPQYDQRSKVSSYLYRISLNRAISWRRKQQARPIATELSGGQHEPTDDSPPPDPRLDIIYAEIRRLKEAERALILLQLDGFNYHEIAETLGLSESNVGVRLTRIRTKLAERLKGQNP